MYQQHAKLGAGGRIIIPATYRKALSLHPGDELILSLEENGEIRLFRQSQAIQRIQAAAKKHALLHGHSHTDNFLAIRKQDSE